MMEYSTEHFMSLVISTCIVVGTVYGVIKLQEYFKNRKKAAMNSEEELEKMYKLRDYFEELQFKHNSIHERVLKELNQEIKYLEMDIFQSLGKVVYEQKRGK